MTGKEFRERDLEAGRNEMNVRFMCRRRDFVVAATHFVQNDRMPALVAHVDGHVVFAGPATLTQFFDGIDFGYTAGKRLHNRLPSLRG